MTFLNSGTSRVPVLPHPEDAPHKDTPLNEYDLNCIFPVKELKSDKVIVTPFIPSLYAQDFLDGSQLDPKGIFRYVRGGPWAQDDLPSVLRFLEVGRKDKTAVLFAVLDTTSGSPVFAGLLRLYLCDLETLSAEIGYVVILPPFRRTHVLTHALSLFLTWVFTPPTQLSSQLRPSSSSSSSYLSIGTGGGLGLRRAQWAATSSNTGSINSALRMGFKGEGIVRNKWTWQFGEEGAAFDPLEELSWERGEDGRELERGRSQDAWIGGITKGDWEAEGGVRELVEKQMRRER